MASNCFNFFSHVISPLMLLLPSHDIPMQHKLDEHDTTH
uniref:Uncharacterized protein n=1 Tax=Rhizophora mucronata TaxID=61149 RepID=A0A2P2QSV4_RHIMU